MGFLPPGVSFLTGIVVKFHFIIGALIALVVKIIMRKLKLDFLINSGQLERISGLSVDFMVTAALSAIALPIVIKFIVPIITISVTAGIATFLFCIYLGSRSFEDYQFERIVTIFGIATGTMATGMTLLRVMDPEFQSPVATDVLYGSGMVFFMTFPIIEPI